MNEPTNIEALILDFLEFLVSRERTYDEVMEAWRTSCPRLAVWEDANERGLVRIERSGSRCLVRATSVGLALLENRKASSE